MPIEQQVLDVPFGAWRHVGLALPRGEEGECDSHVTGDPCVVWDDEIGTWRMFYFGQGSGNCCVAHATIADPAIPDGITWEKHGRIDYTNPEVVGQGAHKPWVLMDPYKPNRAVRIAGAYTLYVVTYIEGHKVIHVASSPSLAGPWTLQEKPVVERGSGDAFDAYHVDTVTAYYFRERRTTLLFYKGYPALQQADQPGSPYGSSTAAVTIDATGTVTKLGKVLSPAADVWHAAGWVSTIQLLPAAAGGWFGLVSASPTPPAPPEEEPRMREPAPSLGTWAYTPEPWPVSGWRVLPEPITTLEALPEEAKAWGEQVNLWRHHLLVLPDGSARLLYNSGSYGQERMFCRSGRALPNGTGMSHAYR